MAFVVYVITFFVGSNFDTIFVSMAIDISMSSKIGLFDLEIYKLDCESTDFIQNQGYEVVVDMSTDPYVIEVTRNGVVDRMFLDRSDIIHTLSFLIKEGELLEEFEICHDLLQIQKTILNDPS